MGRSRWSLLDSDMDVDTYSDVVNDILSLCTDSNPDDDAAFIKSEDLSVPDQEKLNKPEIREKLDAYLCDFLFDIFRNSKHSSEVLIRSARDSAIWLGVAMMEAGAKISDSNLEYLRSIATTYGPTWSLSHRQETGNFAYGMYNTGQAQIVTATNLYQAGTPRSFHEFCCFYCGKIKADIGKEFIKCSRCNSECWCDETCHELSAVEHEEDCSLFCQY